MWYKMLYEALTDILTGMGVNMKDPRVQKAFHELLHVAEMARIPETTEKMKYYP